MLERCCRPLHGRVDLLRDCACNQQPKRVPDHDASNASRGFAESCDSPQTKKGEEFRLELRHCRMIVRDPTTILNLWQNPIKAGGVLPSSRWDLPRPLAWNTSKFFKNLSRSNSNVASGRGCKKMTWKRLAKGSWSARLISQRVQRGLIAKERWVHLPMLPGLKIISPIATNICARSALRSTESSCVRRRRLWATTASSAASRLEIMRLIKSPLTNRVNLSINWFFGIINPRALLKSNIRGANKNNFHARQCRCSSPVVLAALASWRANLSTDL